MSVLWDAACHVAKANRSGFKVMKWATIIRGMAQNSFQGHLANSMSSMDLTYCLSLIALPCTTARWNPAQGTTWCWAPSPAVTSGPQGSAQTTRGGWKGQWSVSAMHMFPHGSQMFFWSSPDLHLYSQIPRESLEEDESLGKSSNSSTNYVRIQASPNLTFFKMKCKTRCLLLPCNSSWSANNIICHGWWQGEKREGWGRSEKKKYWLKL